MSAYLSLIAAIVFEVAGTLMLPLTKEFSEKLPTIVMSICYFVSFYFLTFNSKKGTECPEREGFTYLLLHIRHHHSSLVPS